MDITNVGGGSNMNKKTTKRRRKIDSKKIEDIKSRQVTFTKRSTGLFKKAAEICVLTGAQISILVTSPCGRHFTFRHLNSDVMLDNYLNNNNTTTGEDTGTTTNSPPPLPMKEFNQRYMEVSRELDAEKKRRETIPVIGGGLRWYDEAVDGLDVEELQRYLCSLEELKKKVLTRAVELMMINKSSDALFGSNNGNDQPPVDIPASAVVDDGGFNFEYDGGFGIFS
ncbi:agamous-like MADS-box protein AGL29 [Lactuca sativa]|uniref:agamous-like MADS-box protein AGL29 n=1 Tax=Lactuca sativa TaxID=4236 RepID=UPI000CCB6EB0|nr:agamous-like MADS-box protein AGL29 [Lactuca sativa]